MKTAASFSRSFNADALLRKYAHFEDPAPAPTPTPDPAPSPTPEPSGDPAWLPDRLKRAAEKATEAERKRIYADLGVDDPAADKELLAKARKQAQDDLTEAQKAIAELAKEKTKREVAEQALADRNAEIEAKERAATRDNAVTKALTAANAKADKVLKLLRVDHAAELDAVLKDDGTVDEKQVTKLVETARKDYAEDFGTRGVGTGSHSGGRATDPGSKDRESAAVATFNALRNRI